MCVRPGSPGERSCCNLALVLIGLTILLSGCGVLLRGDASAGPNPGGAPNIDIGRINP